MEPLLVNIPLSMSRAQLTRKTQTKLRFRTRYPCDIFRWLREEAGRDAPAGPGGNRAGRRQ